MIEPTQLLKIKRNFCQSAYKQMKWHQQCCKESRINLDGWKVGLLHRSGSKIKWQWNWWKENLLLGLGLEKGCKETETSLMADLSTWYQVPGTMTINRLLKIIKLSMLPAT